MKESVSMAMKPIDYQVGDIVEPFFFDSTYHKYAKVLDITEKGGDFIMIPSGPKFHVGNHELHLLKKSRIGTLLYGENRQHSKKDSN